MPRHETSIRVRFNELDPYNHVNHAVYVTYFETARTEALASVGLPLHEIQRDGWQFVISELAVRYRRAAVAGDELTVDTWVSDIGGASARWSQRVRRGDTLLVEGELRVAATDGEGRVRRLPPEMTAKLRALLVRPAP